ncbi:MAG: peptidylprolyl isomerase [Luteolibacter sp.]
MGLKVTPLGVNSFKVDWTDNSTNETGFELRVGLKGKSNPPRFLLIPSSAFPVPDKAKKSYTIVTNPLAGKELNFQMTAYNGATGFEVFSNPTPIVTVRALSPSVFAAPTKFKVKILNEFQMSFSWKDNSTSEYAYQVEYKKGKGKWTLLTTLGPSISYGLIASVFTPDTTYSFRVRAYKLNPVVYTPYSEVVTVSTAAFQAPGNLVATVSPEAKFAFKWKDNSLLEEGYELQAKSGTGAFTVLGTVATNTTSTVPVAVANSNTDYQFRIRGFRTVKNVKVYSAFSNVFSAKSSTFIKPTDLVAKVVDDTSIKLTWKDLSARETGYQIQFREAGASTFDLAGTIAANATTTPVYELDPGKLYDFRIRAVDSVGYSDFSQTVQVSTKDGITSALNPQISLGYSFDYTVQSSNPANLTGVTVTGLPVGLTYNPVTRKITGFAKTEGQTTVTIVATYSDGHTSTRSLILKVGRASPIVAQTFSPVTVAVSGNSKVSVEGKFSDPDTTSAARFVSSLGTFDIILFPEAAPITVDNFIDYIDGAKYDNSFIHRSPLTTPVIQGGGFRYSQAEGITEITNTGTIKNEPGLSNVRGTIAMARVGGMVNSATSQWYINTASNDSLDSIDEGFTVFGRVATSGMAVVDQIRGLPIGNYTSQTGFSALNELPVNAPTAPDTLDPANLVIITSVGPAPLLIYQVASSNTAIATASLNGTEITITGVKKGSTTIQVKATDLDGKTVTQNIAVTVP